MFQECKKMILGLLIVSIVGTVDLTYLEIKDYVIKKQGIETRVNAY